MYPNDFLSHVNLSLRRQAEQQRQEKEDFKNWLLATLERLERIIEELRGRSQND